jgi:thioredoxin reductase (NADPH)
MNDYHVVVIGGGPAGLTAGLYAMRSGLKAVLIEKGFVGGQVATTYWVENYPGFPEGINGQELMENMKQQVERLKLPIILDEVQAIESTPENDFKLKLNQKEITTSSIIIASGAYPAMLGVPGESRLRGRGVSYCATCDGAFFKDEELIVVGGGDSAVDEAVFLTRFASRVSIVHRRDSLRAEKLLQQHAFENPKIDFIWNTVLQEIAGENKVEKVVLKNVITNQISTKAVGGVFIYIGLRPNTEFLKQMIKLDDQGFIMTDEQMQTSSAGIFAAGDVRNKLVRQISTAVGDGAIAAVMALKYLTDTNKI